MVFYGAVPFFRFGFILSSGGSVLLWIYSSSTPCPRDIFDGCSSEDVKKFFFLYNSMVMYAKSDEERAMSLL